MFDKKNVFDLSMPSTSEQTIGWQNLHGASVGLSIVNALQKTTQPALIIAPDNLTVARLLEEINFFSNSQLNALHFPDWETLPYDHFSPHQDIISERLTVLNSLAMQQKTYVVASVSTLMHKLAPVEYLIQSSFTLKLGDQLNLDILKTRLVKSGYYFTNQVREHGEFSIRGSIIDIYPMGSETPFRIDLFDNEVDSIRIFSTETQRSLEKISAIDLLPAKEFPLTENGIEKFRQAFRNQFSGNPLKSPLYQDISEGICSPGIEYYLPLFYESTATIFDYLSKDTLVFAIGNVQEKLADFWNEINNRYEQGQGDLMRPLLAPHQLFLNQKGFNNSISPFPIININSSEHNSASSRDSVIDFATDRAPELDINYKASQPLAALQTFLSSYEGRILFCAETLGRREVLLQLFNSIALQPTYFISWEEFLNSNAKYGITVAPIDLGFSLNQPAICLLTESQLYGQRVMQRRLRKKTSQDPDMLFRDITELQINDPVVHIQHGVGRYKGLQTLALSGQEGEFLCLEYQAGDKLYVPVSSLHLISRYTGANPESTPINKLGTDLWQKAKKRAADKVRDVAAELLDLYAKRAARQGDTYEIPQEQYNAFAAAFPFEETPDQLQAIEQVFADLSSTKPMDRVICGDVGFGKTEVALRAAFIAVQNNKQVALLVPTTLLAQQHFQSFQDRLAEWPIQVEMISRFRSAKEQKIILEKMADGKVDIVVGTHKLLQSDIKFKSLGLVIIDEEHRFGVKQKEQLKSLRTSVDILTLTATPIPRTLNMALAGIRDLSIIATPPAKRLSVKTFVHEYQKHIVKEAIQREILRGGQVYFLHNEVTTINKKAEELRELVGEARVGVAHGQMHERDLEKIMSEFYHRHFNVLVCSTIIESGIDIPTANTIIINRADKFGIAQLHQLRGRVGRSHHQAYAYLLIPSQKHITADAKKRLEAVTAFDDLGIGFTLASHDLEIRGAGELLGEEQSGEIHEIGFTLYMDLLSRAVEDLKKGELPSTDFSTLYENTEVELHVAALIPENYIGDVRIRLQFYKRIANTKTETDLDEIQIEMIDRFGLLPQVVKTLVAITLLKQQANKLGITKIVANDKGGKIEFGSKPQIKPETLIHLIQTKHHRYKLEGPTRLRYSLDSHEPLERANLVQAILSEISA